MQPISTNDNRGQAARCFEWSDPFTARNSQLDKSASVQVAELLTVMVSGTSRRNVLGAIAWKRSIATSRSDDSRDEHRQQLQRQPNQPKQQAITPKRCRCATTPMETVLA